MKKNQIAKKMGESERAKHIRETNERVHAENTAMVIKDRHARRHLGKKGTTLKERKDWMSEMSKDS